MDEKKKETSVFITSKDTLDGANIRIIARKYLRREDVLWDAYFVRSPKRNGLQN